MRNYMKLGCVALLTVLLAACGHNNNLSMNGMKSDTDFIAETMAATTAEQEAKSEITYEGGFDNVTTMDGNANNGQVETGRKLIKNVSMDVETEEFDSFIRTLLNRINGLGGYVENSNTNNSSYYVNNNRSANYMIRIPSERLDELVGNVTELANVTWKEESVRDITLQYVDIESHKIALQTEQERLLVLMEQAETVEDLIAIESRLSEIRYQIQSYESTLRTYDNQVNYSTLHLAVLEVKKLTPQEEPNIWEKIQDGFLENLEQVMIGIRDFFVEIIIDIPYLVIWGIVLFLGFWVGKKFIKRKDGKKRVWNFGKLKKRKEDSEVEKENKN